MEHISENSNFYKECYKVAQAEYERMCNNKRFIKAHPIHSKIATLGATAERCRIECFKSREWADCLYWTLVERYYSMMNSIILTAELHQATTYIHHFQKSSDKEKRKMLSLEKDPFDVFEERVNYILIQANNRNQDYKVLKHLSIQNKLEEINQYIYNSFEMNLSDFSLSIWEWRSLLTGLGEINPSDRPEKFAHYPKETYLQVNNRSLFNQIIKQADIELFKQDTLNFLNKIH